MRKLDTSTPATGQYRKSVKRCDQRHISFFYSLPPYPNRSCRKREKEIEPCENTFPVNLKIINAVNHVMFFMTVSHTHLSSQIFVRLKSSVIQLEQKRHYYLSESVAMSAIQSLRDGTVEDVDHSIHRFRRMMIIVIAWLKSSEREKRTTTAKNNQPSSC